MRCCRGTGSACVSKRGSDRVTCGALCQRPGPPAPVQTRGAGYLSLRSVASRARGSVLGPLSRALPPKTRGCRGVAGAAAGPALRCVSPAKPRCSARGRGRLRAAPRSARSAAVAPRGGESPLLPACRKPRRAHFNPFPAAASPRFSRRFSASFGSRSRRSAERGAQLPRGGTALEPRRAPGAGGCGAPAAAGGARRRPLVPPASVPRAAERAVTATGLPRWEQGSNRWLGELFPRNFGCQKERQDFFARGVCRAGVSVFLFVRFFVGFLFVCFVGLISFLFLMCFPVAT